MSLDLKIQKVIDFTKTFEEHGRKGKKLRLDMEELRQKVEELTNW